MNEKRYWFPVKPARNGWGWGLPRVWQGWAVLAVFAALLTGGLTALTPYGPMILALYGTALGILLVGVACWKGEPQFARDHRSP